MTNEAIHEGTHVPITCPSCSPGVETVHEVLKLAGRATVRCTECNHVHKSKIEETESITLDVIVSQDNESFSATTKVASDGHLHVGSEFVLETDEAVMVVRITSVELVGERRTDAAPATDVRTIWTRAVDNVAVNVSLHPSDGTRDKTRSIKVYVPGDYTFTVGNTETLAGEEFTINGIHARRDARFGGNRKLDGEGETVEAKDIQRIYARDERSTGWSSPW